MSQCSCSRLVGSCVPVIDQIALESSNAASVVSSLVLMHWWWASLLKLLCLAWFIDFHVVVLPQAGNFRLPGNGFGLVAGLVLG